ncbi:helix-turn-helix transcriptional regulator [Lacticaseibacillus paracasei]|jgi:transcriptional regulator with XRE-family HTH domain|uniref:helix-turn-helix transcriptional regulator n=1 Tax=Lacticaseibacillus paracasei TaxID=1597 RepID=UPI00069FD92F|nr:helix-turn-helix transcriptional regulator [Lacticaseibacillus paracasei]
MIENFGRNVARLRKQYDMSQEDLANKIGVKKQSISNIERGVRYPTFETLEKFAKVFNATPVELFGSPKEVALNDVPDVLDRIDAYDERIRTIFQIGTLMDHYSASDLDKIAYQVDHVMNFFAPHPLYDDDAMPILDDDNKVRMFPGKITRLPLDKLDEIVKKIDYVLKNEDKL